MNSKPIKFTVVNHTPIELIKMNIYRFWHMSRKWGRDNRSYSCLSDHHVSTLL